jgi:hypothetical protein
LWMDLYCSKFDTNTEKMKHKKIILSILFPFAFSFANAQMVNGNAYIKGTGVEIGIDSLGGFEGANTTVSPPPAGMHFRSNTPYFGFVANPQANSWSTFDGDFFSPGTPENGWGFEIGSAGMSRGNNCNMLNEINGRITSWSHIGTLYSVNWEGDLISGSNLHFLINYLLDETDLFYTTTITIVNNTMATIPDLYYYRNVDPDNNISLTGDYTTQNTIVSQYVPGGTTVAQVSAEQTTPWNSYFAFVAIDSNFVAGYGGFSNRDASDMYDGLGFTQTVGSTNYADEAIYMAYHVLALAPGDSATFKFCSVFDQSSVDCAINSLAVSFHSLAAVTPTTPAFVLTQGTPTGGIYSGTGVIGGNTFDPSVSGSGTFNLVYTVTDSTGCSSSATSSILVDVSAGINNEMVNNVSVYPNPFTDQTVVSLGNITSEHINFSVYDVLGKEVISMKEIRNPIFKLERNNLPAGVYFYRLSDNNKTLKEGKILMK